MRISRKAEYALRALLILAARTPSSPMQIQELAEKGRIPVKFLEQILLILKRADLLQSKRGIGGGYQLKRAANEITLAEVIRLLDGPPGVISEGSDGPVSAPGCRALGECLQELNGMIVSYLTEQTIESLLRREEGDVMAFEI